VTPRHRFILYIIMIICFLCTSISKEKEQETFIEEKSEAQTPHQEYLSYSNC
jgi:hypothetical protein